jgi:FkbM family methyltransferase
MRLLGAIRSTARVSDYLFRHAFPLYALLYERYKRAAERDVIACIRRLVRPGDRVVDVGANIGFYAELLAECAGPTGAVYAFEPEPLNFARLAARARAYPQLHAVAACLGERGGTAELFLSPDLNIDHRTYPTGDERRSVRVDALALDEFLPAGEQLRFVKMDVQGAEYAALSGMRATLARSPDVHLLLEVWPYVQERFAGGTRALLGRLDEWGFCVHRLAAGGALGERLAPDLPIAGADDENYYFDVLCMRPARHTGGEDRAAC